VDIYKHKAAFDSKSSLLRELKTMLTHKMKTTYKNSPTDQKGYPHFLTIARTPRVSAGITGASDIMGHHG
jgi:hypothetical protein